MIMSAAVPLVNVFESVTTDPAPTVIDPLSGIELPE